MQPVHDKYAERILEEYHKHVGPVPSSIPPVPTSVGETITVGIIGAGVAGLFTAMLLEKAIKDHGLNIKYEILEAETIEGGHPVGGRLWTHRFSDSDNDYYDRGAMRFPDIPWMKPVMDLFTELELDKVKIPYILSTDENLNFFNGKSLTNAGVKISAQEGKYDPFNTKVTGINGTVDDMVTRQIEPFRNALKADFDKGFEALMKYDAWSTRGYMRLHGTAPHGSYDGQVISYLETFGSSTGIYDQALTETVISSLDFDYEEGVKWYCIQGGCSVFSDAMKAKIPAENICNGARATAIAPTDSGLSVKIAGELKPRTYSHVISTIPFSTFRMVDTSQCNFSWDLRTAIRSLQYNASTKIGIKFSRRWWEEIGQKGGVSRTDRPTRLVVYPSYGIGGTDATMIVSYTLAQDALRLGAFSGASDPKQNPIALDVILRDLADMHGITDRTYLPSLVSAYDIWPWDHHENSAGAFAHFGPGQFSQLYPQVTKPAANGKLHFAGEAASVYHGWVVGALNSAARAIDELAYCEGREDLVQAVQGSWRLADIEIDLCKKQVALGLAGY